MLFFPCNNSLLLVVVAAAKGGYTLPRRVMDLALRLSLTRVNEGRREAKGGVRRQHFTLLHTATHIVNNKNKHSFRR